MIYIPSLLFSGFILLGKLLLRSNKTCIFECQLCNDVDKNIAELNEIMNSKQTTTTITMQNTLAQQAVQKLQPQKTPPPLCHHFLVTFSSEIISFQ